MNRIDSLVSGRALLAALLVLTGCTKPDTSAIRRGTETSPLDISQRAADGEKALSNIPTGAPGPAAPIQTPTFGELEQIPPDTPLTNLDATLRGNWAVTYDQKNQPSSSALRTH